MDYFTIIPNRRANPLAVSWLENNIPKNDYMWEVGVGSRVLYFRFESDLLVFRLRWGL